MAAGFVLVLAVPWTRTFFSLRPYNPATDLIALAIAGCAAAALNHISVGCPATRSIGLTTWPIHGRFSLSG